MKKLISLVLAAIVLASLVFSTGCSFTLFSHCDICGSKDVDYSVGEDAEFCSDCYYDYFYDDDDYDYDYDYGGYGNNCYECGKSIDEDRIYCDKCLGYGTCQDCGKDIDDDRLYCDKCLGYGTCQDCGKDIPDDRLYCDYCLYN